MENTKNKIHFIPKLEAYVMRLGAGALAARCPRTLFARVHGGGRRALCVSLVAYLAVILKRQASESGPQYFPIFDSRKFKKIKISNLLSGRPLGPLGRHAPICQYLVCEPFCPCALLVS